MPLPRAPVLFGVGRGFYNFVLYCMAVNLQLVGVVDFKIWIPSVVIVYFR